jgi:uncharacterized membrane protein YdjX (TVP38/TMEM64 family)
MPKPKNIAIWVWIAVIAAALYAYFFKADLIRIQVDHILNFPLSWRYALYLILGCLRGFTFIPVTYLILLGLVFLPATPAYILTLIGVIVSSACIYYFAGYIGLADFFERYYPDQIAKLKSVISKNELPIVISWSFFPFTPTDVMCYVCGSLGVNFKKFLAGVLIGEGISCALYIFAGKELLLFLVHKLIGA